MSIKNAKVISIGIFLYSISTLLSFIIWSYLGVSKPIKGEVPFKQTGTATSVFDDSLPKTEPCPLNGVRYSKKQREWWERHRPMGVMIENHEEARPQSGLSSVDVVYEAVAEGGITRFLSVFYCQDAGIVGPVRSARTYFLDFISEYGNNPLYVHVGGANQAGFADALSQIEQYGWGSYNDLNQFSVGFPTFWRDYERLGHPVATEHAMYASVEKLWDFAEKKRNLANVDKKGTPWSKDFSWYTFKEDETQTKLPLSQEVSFEFWQGYSMYAVKWQYDKTQNAYKRFNAGAPHLDKNNNKQLTAKNVVVLFMTERHANDGYEDNAHLLYATKGTGRALIFRDGSQIEGTWFKKDREARTILKDSDAREIELNRGIIWFEIVPKGGAVTVK